MNVIATRLARTRTWRAVVISTLGPLTSVAGLAWAVWQPYRVTLLHPHHQGFWWLVLEPPLYVMLVGVLFSWFVVRGLLEDLDATEG